MPKPRRTAPTVGRTLSALTASPTQKPPASFLRGRRGLALLAGLTLVFLANTLVSEKDCQSIESSVYFEFDERSKEWHMKEFGKDEHTVVADTQTIIALESAPASNSGRVLMQLLLRQDCEAKNKADRQQRAQSKQSRIADAENRLQSFADSFWRKPVHQRNCVEKERMIDRARAEGVENTNALRIVGCTTFESEYQKAEKIATGWLDVDCIDRDYIEIAEGPARIALGLALSKEQKAQAESLLSRLKNNRCSE